MNNKISFEFIEWWYSSRFNELIKIVKKHDCQIDITWLKKNIFFKKAFVIINGSYDNLLSVQNILEKYE